MRMGVAGKTGQLPGGGAQRVRPAGLSAGAPLSHISGPAEALGLVAEELADAELVLNTLVMSDVAAVPAVSRYLVDAGGKRLRPALTALGALAAGVTPSPRLMCCGELIHLGSLLHDDVVDDGVTRRGQPATHRVFGNAVTVLTGDFCLARAVLLAAEEGGHGAVLALARAVTEMAEGEVLQLQRAGNLDCGLEDYLEVIERKSAALIAWCVGAGAWAHENAEKAQALEAFGRSIGLAFQITDDVLDYRSGTGKEPGIDLRERKVNLPLLMAMEKSTTLRQRLEAGPPSSGDIPSLIATVADTGALESSLDVARDYVERGIGRLSILPDNAGRRALEALGRFLVERSQ